MRLIGYVRVSSDQQRQSGASMEAQIEKINAMAVLKGATLIEIVQDAGESAKDLDRPGMKRVLEMVRTRQVDAVVISKLDRITRSVKDLDELMSLFKDKDVSLISIEESLDMSTATGRMMMNLISVVSQWEREVIGERTSTALQQIKASGCPAGPAPYGYSAQPRPEVNGKKQRMPLLTNDAEQHTIRVIVAKSKEHSLRELADMLNAAGYRTRRGGMWHFTAVGRIVREHGKVAA